MPRWLSRPLLAKAIADSRGDKMPGAHIDLHRGHDQSEVEYLNGAVVRAGEKFGIPTPANLLLLETVMPLVRGEADIEEYRKKPEKLLADF